MMRASWYSKFGTASDVLQTGEFEKPDAGPGEVLIRLHCSGVNPSDVKKRAGSFPTLLDDGPVIPNSDGAGTIVAIGNGVAKRRIGERVWVYQAQFARRFGTAAEFIAIDEQRAPRLPDNVSFEIGACLGIPAMTAHRCVFADGDVNGQTILITGGAGRVGYYAIQWANMAGATVIASASRTADAEACTVAGAAFIVNHRDEHFAEAIVDANKGALVDRVIDVEFGANLSTTVDVLRVGGTIATYSSTNISEPSLPFLKMMYKDLTIRFVIVYAMPENAKQLAVSDLENALGNDQLRHRIAQILPLQDIVASNELIERGDVRGAVILAID